MAPSKSGRSDRSANRSGNRSHRSKPSSPSGVIRKSPRAVPRLNYRETRARASSSVGSTTTYGRTVASLQVSLDVTLVIEAGETYYVGTGVFTLPEAPKKTYVQVTRVAMPEPDPLAYPKPPEPPVEPPFPYPPTFDAVKYIRQQRAYDRKLRKQAKEIKPMEALALEQRRERELFQARQGKRKVGETPHVPFVPLTKTLKEMLAAKVKTETSSEPYEKPGPYVRTPPPLSLVNPVDEGNP